MNETQMIIFESQKGNRKRMVAKICSDSKGLYLIWKGYEYRVLKKDIVTGFLIFKRPKKGVSA